MRQSYAFAKKYKSQLSLTAMSTLRKSMKWLVILIILLLSVTATAVGILFSNQNLTKTKKTVYIGSDVKHHELPDLLKKQGLIRQSQLFELLWYQLNPAQLIYPGAYKIPEQLSMIDVLRLFRSGKREEVKVTLSGRIRLDGICALVGEKLEVDSSEMSAWLIDSSGVSYEQIICYFLSDTYRFNWAGKPKNIWNRFQKEYNIYWNEQRKSLAADIDLKPEEVITLASIVEAEVKHEEEMPRVAGVYLNRLRENWLLGADPTLQFLIKEEGRQRILNKDKKIDSPYNTYMYPGLPPGPLFCPSKRAIMAVLNAEKHDYMFFCAREDFSGYHNFTSSLRVHNINANRYRRALDRAGIKR
jgi:UPF0755 protein